MKTESPSTKQMSVGQIPVEWECRKLADFMDGFEAGTSVGGEDRTLCEGEVAVLKVSAVSEGIFRPDEYKVVTPEDASRLSVCPCEGEIIVSRANTLELVGASAFVHQDWPDRFLPDKLWQTKLAEAVHVDTKWLSYVLGSSRTRKDISGRATGTSGSMKNISQSAFLGIRIPFPPLPEQRRIAEILSTWDRAIEQTEKLIEAKERLKKGLMQRLLTGELRFPEFGEAPWETHRLGKLFKRVTRKNDAGVEHVLTASGEHGLVDQREYFNRSVAGKSLAGYYHLKRGEFAYNRSSMQGYPYGAIKRLDDYPEGVLSTLYTCFGLNSDLHCSDFFMHYFEAGVLNRQLRGVVQVGARAHGLLNVAIGDFFGLKVKVPSLQEQEWIASVLNACDSEISLLRRKLEAIQQQKKGLMQKLLTGKVRVKT